MLPPRLVACLCSVAVSACGGGPGDSFASGVDPSVTTVSGTAEPGSTSTAAGSTSGTASSTGSGEAGSTSAASTAGDNSSSAAGNTTTIYDLGADGDFGPAQPPGCKDKIDFLFMMQRTSQKPETQAKLIAAFPQFIATIEERFAGFDVQIMVVDSDWNWGVPDCDPFGCLATDNDGCQVDEIFIPDYPCGVYTELEKDECNYTLGAGVTFNAGPDAANKPCAIDGPHRFVTGDQTDLAGTFACMAQVGQYGSQRVGEVIVEALSPELNQPGGCNAGFVRDDALLMITIVVTSGDEVSKDEPEDWANAVFAAKNGNKSSVIVLGIGGWLEPPETTGELGEFISLFPYHKFGHITAPSYAEHFASAVELVDEACKIFTPG